MELTNSHQIIGMHILLSVKHQSKKLPHGSDLSIMSSQQLTSLFRSAAIVMGLSIFLAAQTPTPAGNDRALQVETEEIKLNVSAFNRYGEFVPGVKKEDLVIVEDGRLHQANSVRRIPANVLIVLDMGGEMRYVKSLKHTRNTAKKLVAALSPRDSVAILEYHDKATILTHWTSNKQQILSDLDKKLNFGRRAVFVDALMLATEFLKRTDTENRHLVLVTDGTDSFDRNDEREREMKKLMTTNINVHVISYTQLELSKVAPKTKRTGTTPHPNPLPDEVIQGLPEALRTVNRAPKFGVINTDKKFLRVMRKRQQDLIDGEKYLLDLSKNTSGMFILPQTKDEMLRKTSLIARIIDSNYVVTYTPKRALSKSPNGEIRTIEVSSRKPGLQVLARRKLIVENKTKNKN